MTIVNTFQQILKNSTELHSNKNPSTRWVDKGSSFYNNSFKKWLQNNNIQMYSTQNEFCNRSVKSW